MKREYRTQRRLKWVGTLLSALILAAFVRSVRHWDDFIASEDRYAVSLVAGTISFEWIPDIQRTVAPKRGWHFGPYEGVLFWQPCFRSTPLWIFLPLWIPFAVLAIPTAVLWNRWWRQRRAIPAGHCQQCRYDLTGNVSGMCPECGTQLKDQP